MKNIFLIISLIIFCNIRANAQQDRFQWRVGAYSGIMSYYGDLSNKWIDPNDQLLHLFDHTDYISYGVSLEKSLSKTWGIRLLYSKGQFIANDRQVDWSEKLLLDHSTFNRSLNVKTELSDWSILGSYYFDNEKILGKSAFLAPFLTIGGGWTDFKTYGDLYDSKSDRYHYWTDGTIRNADEASGNGIIIEQDGVFETPLRNLQTEGKNYKANLFHFTAGLGLKFRLSNRLNLNLESLIHFTDKDYLDDVSGKHLSDFDNAAQQYAATPGTKIGEYRGNENGKNDIYTFTTISLHYNFGRKRNAFVAPAILIGTLNQAYPQEDTIVKVDTIEVDTQAIYIATIEIDSAYLVSDVTNNTSEMGIDTIYKVGNQIYSVGNEKQWTEGEDRWDMVQQYFYDEELLLDSLYSTSEAALDTQIIYLVNVPVDSTFVLEDFENAEEDLSENIVIDTVFQVGNEFYTDDFSDFIQEENWEVIRDQYLDIPETENPDLSYEEYLEIEATAELSVNNTLDSTTIITPEEELVIEKTVEPKTISEQPSIDSIYNKINQLSEEINQVKSQKTTTQDSITNNRLNQIQSQLDSLRIYQSALSTGMNEEWKQTFEQATQQLERQIQVAQQKEVIPVVQQESKEVIQLRTEIEYMKKLIDQKNDPELESMKKQLWLYELQLKNDRTDRQRYNEMNAELKALKNNYLVDQNASTPQSPTEVVMTVDPNLSALQAEVTSLNQSIESMKQLLVQQQLANNNSGNQPIVTDNNLVELMAMRTEIAALKATLSNTNQPAPIKTNLNNQQELQDLKNQVIELQNQLVSLQKPIITSPVIVEKEVPPTNKVIDLKQLIRGKEKQTVFFGVGSAVLSFEALNTIQTVSRLLSNYPQIDVLLEGYTDSSGNPEKNLLLSKKRTEAVKFELQKQGVNESQIILDYRGEDLQSNAAYGRRVELKLQPTN